MENQNDNPNNLPMPDEMGVQTRNVLMFRDWLGGMNYGELAKKYGIAYQTVRHVSHQNKWLRLRKQYTDRAYREAVNSLKDIVTKMQAIMEVDITNLYEQIVKEKRAITLEERAYITANMEKLLKQISKDSTAADAKDAAVKGNPGVLVKKVTIKLPPGQKPESVSALVPAGNVSFETDDPSKELPTTTLEDLDKLNEEDEEAAEG